MAILEKIKTRDELKSLCMDWKAQGKKIGFTSGSFDLIHAGHAAYLEKAREKCNILIVGVNTDGSVKKYKGENRPLVPEKERIWLIASQASVNYAFLFDERRNNSNIEQLQPDFYIKAGDYKEEELSSKELVEKFGGNVILIPLEFKTSTSELVEKIMKTFGITGSGIVEEGGAVHISIRSTKVTRAVFLDRDGTINVDIEYLHEPERFKLTNNAIEGIRKMQDLGFKRVVVTTQAGIGLGYFTKEDFYKVNREMFRQFTRNNIVIDKIYFCPHSKGDNCSCRKPGTALFIRARDDLHLDLAGSYVIGDKTSDIEAGRRIGCKTILISSSKLDSEYRVTPDYVAVDLLDAAGYILSQERKL